MPHHADIRRLRNRRNQHSRPQEGGQWGNQGSPTLRTGDSPTLEDLWRQADDLHEILLAELAGNRPEDPRAARVALVVDDDCGVLVECDLAAVLPAVRLLPRHHDLHTDLAR